jgi:hypothetical protein
LSKIICVAAYPVIEECLKLSDYPLIIILEPSGNTVIPVQISSEPDGLKPHVRIHYVVPADTSTLCKNIIR